MKHELSLYDELGEERKDLQEKGLLPKWVTTLAWQMLKENYLKPEYPDLKSVYSRVAKHAAKYTTNPKEWEEKFFELFWKGWLAASTPVLSNMGTGFGCPVSCSGGVIPDSVIGFYDSQKEAAVLSKNGFGTSGYLGSIRPRGAKITGMKGSASGVLPVFKDFVQVSRDISQGSCYANDAEILTENGWMLFDNLIAEHLLGNDVKVAQISDDNIVEFVVPSDYIKNRYVGELISFNDSKNIDIPVTPNHTMIAHNRKRVSNIRDAEGKFINHEKYISPEFVHDRADSIRLHRDKIFQHSGFVNNGEHGLTMFERLLIAYQADGTPVKYSKTSMRFRFSKHRKIERLKYILNELELEYSEKINEDGTVNIYVLKTNRPIYKTFSWIKPLSELSLTWCVEFLEECLLWDGNQYNSYCSIIEENIDAVQSIAAICGYKSKKSMVVREGRKNLYKIYLSKGELFGTENIKKKMIDYDDYVYCVTVNSGRIIVRSNGHTLVCGNSRRGAWAGYIEIDHPDFFELVNFINKTPDDANIGWCVSDNFIERLNNGDKDAIERFQKSLKLKMITGKGYYFFTDKVNRQNPQMYKDKDLQVLASNLCVAPETRILTDVGYIEIQELENQKIKVWNGEIFSETVVKKTGENQKLIRVILSSGQELECTPYHKFYVVKDYRGRIEEVRAIDLQPEDKLIKFELPIIDGTFTLNDAYANGFYSGDGCSSKGTQLIYLYHEKRNLRHLFEDIGSIYVDESQNREIIRTKKLKDKFFVPLNNYTIESRLNWLAGICDSDGCIVKNGTNESLQIGNINKDFLISIQEMLQTLGVNSKVTKSKDAGYKLLPANDGSGELKEYLCKDIYRLLVSSSGLCKLQSLGLVTHRLILSNHLPNRNAEQFSKVVSVIDEGRIDDTYCFNEPLKHMGMFNGILTGQCSEIALMSDEEHTFSCVLSSMNAALYDEWKDTDAVFNATVFLDCVNQDLVEIGKNTQGMEKVVKFAEKSRALGLGLLGFHSYLQDNLIPFESFEAHLKNIEIFKHLREESLRASQWMAQEFGEPEWCVGYGVRNTHTMAVAPNLSSALICGSVSQGIEPIYKNAYIQNTAAGKMTRVNPSLLKIMKDKGIYSDGIVNDLIANNGSVQHVEWLTEQEKQVFKTAFEIDQKTIIKLASARQKYIDQAQSINLFFSADEDEEYIAEVHQMAFLDKYIKSLYYIRSETGVNVSKGECLSCHG